MFQGRRALAVGLLAGALAALAMPPLHWLPLAILGIVVFVWQWDASPTARIALLRGWAWGLGHFAVGSYWMIEAFFVPPADFAWLGPPAVLGLAVVLGLFPGLAAGGTRWLALRWPVLAGRWTRLLMLAIAWTALEWLRGHIFTGDPWNPLGHVWAFSPALLQSAGLFGVYGLGMLSFVVLAAPAAGWRAAVAALAVVGVAGGLGMRIMPPIDEAAEGPIVRIVQPNTPQADKWREGSEAPEVHKLLALSRKPGFEKLAAVIWPETAVPFVVTPNSPALPTLALAAPPGGYLLTGAIRATRRRADGLWNSLLVIDSGGAIAAYYDKVHLVPFGEYIPFHKEIAPLAGLTGRGSFEMGDGQVTLAPPGLPAFSPVICFEAVFPGAVTGPGPRPSWLLNVTNDAWFGVSTGPYQHFTSARLRTIEEGLPMIRAANTGVSAVIDAYGRVLASLDMEQQGIIDHTLPPRRSATPYAEWHDLTLLALIAAFAVAIVVTSWCEMRFGSEAIRSTKL
ncbi:MAG TPA: apolipoprotein N-acyltransferase [Reyranella sp.]|nr:apolipoprotein N-acyltransferase [Reyranella sp.]